MQNPLLPWTKLVSSPSLELLQIISAPLLVMVLLPRIASHLWKPVQGLLFSKKSFLNIKTHSSFSSFEYDMSYGQCHSFGSPERQLILSYIVNSCTIYFCVYLASSTRLQLPWGQGSFVILFKMTHGAQCHAGR